MKRHEIFLDFTALLDVILVILFFFIMYSHFETASSKSEMEEAAENMNSLSEEYEIKNREAEEQRLEAQQREKEASELLEELKSSDERQVFNIKGIMEFGHSVNLRAELLKSSSSENWRIDFYRGDEYCGTVNEDDPSVMAEKTADIIAEEGYTDKDTVLCEFVYNASARGTADIYRKVKRAVNELQKDYMHFYFSEIDISNIKGE